MTGVGKFFRILIHILDKMQNPKSHRSLKFKIKITKHNNEKPNHEHTYIFIEILFIILKV